MGRGKAIEVSEWVYLDQWTDEDIIEEIKDRNLEEEFTKVQKTENHEIGKQKAELFKNHMPNLSWEQWNYIFKDVQRRTPAERAKMPKDYSLVLEESIS